MEIVCRAGDVPPGGCRIFPVDGGLSVGVFNLAGRFFALQNACPHQGGPVCVGRVSGTTDPVWQPGDRPRTSWVREGEILRCPWHGWEFDIASGESVVRPTARVRRFPVRVEAGTDSPRGTAAPEGGGVPDDARVIVDI